MVSITRSAHVQAIYARARAPIRPTFAHAHVRCAYFLFSGGRRRVARIWLCFLLFRNGSAAGAACTYCTYCTHTVHTYVHILNNVYTVAIVHTIQALYVTHVGGEDVFDMKPQTTITAFLQLECLACNQLILTLIIRRNADYLWCEGTRRPVGLFRRSA